ncbi:hypothetical protein [Thiocapsa sp.]
MAFMTSPPASAGPATMVEITTVAEDAPASMCWIGKIKMDVGIRVV